jgi:transcriptional regulator with XRE-family HTH domain
MAWTKQLGEEIAKARRRAGMSQKQLHRAIGVSRQMIGSYEKGKTPPPFETLASIAAVLGAEEFVVEDLHVTFSLNGRKPRIEPMPQQLILDFDDKGGATVRIESTRQGVLIKQMLA